MDSQAQGLSRVRTTDYQLHREGKEEIFRELEKGVAGKILHEQRKGRYKKGLPHGKTGFE